MNKKIGASVILLLVFTQFVLAQEKISSLITNNALAEAWKKESISPKNLKGIKGDKILDLPFFDDFAILSVYPNPNLWQDKYAYINSTLAIAPPSIGVATLDAINAKGEIHGVGRSNSYFSSDTLTSQPINLDNSFQNVYLSFAYQPQGLGDNPEYEDSLIVEFYLPDENIWQVQWSVTGSETKDFKWVILPVDKPEFLKQGFQFRFRNFVSLSPSNRPSFVGNVDFWNIDYVYLNKNRHSADTIPDDLAFTEPIQSLLRDYESVPWKHLRNQDIKKYLRTNFSAELRNNYNASKSINNYGFYLTDLRNNSVIQHIPAGNASIAPFEQRMLESGQAFKLKTNTDDSAKFEIKVNFVTDISDPIDNNTSSYIQKFYNYYAYDDGSAEVGYGLSGEGSKYARLAYRFDVIKEDSIRGVYMYFTQTLNNASKKGFNLKIWNDNNGQPGDEIYQQFISSPKYNDFINSYYYFPLEKDTLLSGTFYIGWEQLSEDLLNIGMDRNRNQQKRIFFNINGNWENSSIEGALMIRPVFGNTLDASYTKIHKELEQHDFSVYPNPANRQIVLKFDTNQKRNVSIFNLSGKCVFASEYQASSFRIETSQFPEGMYFVRVEARNTQTKVKKIVIFR
ncbi:MAG: hypothetical protein CSA05_02170 [Bacteroidia bacterium]|nr:MAG: hypothetical protein CSA05_02170 [Bacteroidia bacterium]